MDVNSEIHFLTCLQMFNRVLVLGSNSICWLTCNVEESGKLLWNPLKPYISTLKWNLQIYTPTYQNWAASMTPFKQLSKPLCPIHVSNKKSEHRMELIVCLGQFDHFKLSFFS